MKNDNLKKLFSPKSIAVVGASSNLYRFGGIPIRLTKDYGFKGNIYPINPNHKEIYGLKCYPDISSLPETPDFALFCTRRENIVSSLKECAERGVGVSVIMTSGFKETGEKGANIQKEILEIASKSGMRILGPNCMGIVHVRSKLMATFTISIREDKKLLPGSVSLITQSGAIGACMLSSFQESSIGISSLVSLGNESDVDFSDCVDYFLDDKNTKVICGYLESIRNGEKLKRTAQKALEKGKPIVLFKGGTTEEGALAAASHTAALTTENNVFEAFAEQYGIQVCHSYDQIIETVEFLTNRKKIKGNRLGILSFSGGFGSLCADLAVENGFAVPSITEKTQKKVRKHLSEYAPVSNPVDLVSLMVSRPDQSPLEEVAKNIISDENIDALCLVMGVYHHVGDKIAEDFQKIFKNSKKPVSLAWLAGPDKEILKLRENGVPIFKDHLRAIKGLCSLLTLERKRESYKTLAGFEKRTNIKRKEKAHRLIDSSFIGKNRLLPLETSLDLLDLYKIKKAKTKIINSTKAAIEFWRENKNSVALKIHSDIFTHKTEINGVAINLDNETTIRKKADEFLKISDKKQIIIQSMIQDNGVEVFAGISLDNSFGLCMSIGLGGIFVETLKEIKRVLPPVSPETVIKLMKELKGSDIFSGFRGKKKLHLKSLASSISNLSLMAVELSDFISEVDINPIIVTSNGAFAVDIRIFLKK